jgi:hypothetical protein
MLAGHVISELVFFVLVFSANVTPESCRATTSLATGVNISISSSFSPLGRRIHDDLAVL